MQATVVSYSEKLKCQSKGRQSKGQFLIELYLVCTSHKDCACMLIVSATINMPQTLMYKGLEACHVNRLMVFAYL